MLGVQVYRLLLLWPFLIVWSLYLCVVLNVAIFGCVLNGMFVCLERERERERERGGGGERKIER